MEVWKQIPSIKTHEASNLGRVRNVKTKRIMKQSTTSGYYRVFIKKTCLVHRLVAEAFLDKGDYKIVHHKDNDKKNNNVENLEWNTQSYNVKKAYKDGRVRCRKGENNPNYKNGLWTNGARGKHVES